MNTFLLSFDATTSFSGGNPPTLEILVGGIVVSSVVMQSGATSYDVFVEYTGTAPSTLDFRFDGSSGDPGDTITFTAVSINDNALNLGTDLTATILMQAQTSGVTAAADYFGHTTPTLGATTISGTGSDDGSLNGSHTDDTIDALAGNDRVRGLGGNDEINGGTGDDVIFGEGGNDTVIAGGGNDVVFGNDGDDILYGEADNDYLIGGAGNDILNGGAGVDGLIGDAGNDVMFGEGGDDWLVGDAGDDIMFGDDGNDTLVGGADNDALSGGDGIDQLIGGTGNDLLAGGAGDDEILGGDGNDTASGGAGADDIYGGDGNDELDGGADNDHVSGGDGDDILDGDGGVDVVIGGAGADTISGGAGNDILHGHGLDADAISDILVNNPNVVYSQDTGSFYQFVSANVNYAAAVAAATATTINGVAGHLVTITSAAESDFVGSIVTDDSFTSGADTAQDGTWQWNAGLEAGIQFSDQSGTAVNNMYEDWDAGQPQTNSEYNVVYQNGNDTWHDWADTSTHSYVIEWESALFSDDNAIDTIDGGSGNDWLYGHGGNDVLSGGADNDVLFGGSGNDTLNGDDGNDSLIGGDGNDTINGGNNVDTIAGGAGDDIINGDGGNDILYGADNNGVATPSVDNNALEFDGANDSISLTGLNNNTGNGDTVTVEFWMEWDGTGNSMPFSFQQASGTRHYNLWFDGTSFGFNSWANNIYGISDAGLANTLVHVAAVFTDNDISANQLYINGVSQSLSFVRGGDSDTNAQLTTTGQISGVTSTNTYDFDGVLDEVRIWNGTRTSTEINDNMNVKLTGSETNLVAYYDFENISDGAGGITDEGPNGDDGTLNGTTVATASVTRNDIISSGGYTGDGDTSETNTINGGAGTDTIYGSVGTDTLNGGADNDTIYSGSDSTNWDAAVAAVLAANAGVVYSADTNSFYQVVASTVDWDVANAAANAATLTGYTGVTGHLATITSQAEQDFLEAQASGNSAWLGGGDFGTEGVWRWTAGPEAGAQFANSTGGQVGSWYNSWAGGQPNDSDGTQDYLYMLNGTDWADLVIEGDGSTGFVTVPRYIIEWEADTLITTVESTTIDGGSGDDTLYGNDGIDTFVYDSATWSGSGDVDTIENFDTTSRDAIDISDLLTGYSYINSDITDFVRLTEAGGNTTIAVDANGTTGGSSYTDVAVLNGVTGLDLYQMIAADNLIV